MLSTVNKVEKDKAYWVEVEPIEWLMDPSGKWVAKKALYSGIKYDSKDGYDGKFEDTDIHYYQNTYFTAEIQTNEITVTNEMFEEALKTLGNDLIKAEYMTQLVPQVDEKYSEPLKAAILKMMQTEEVSSRPDLLLKIASFVLPEHSKGVFDAIKDNLKLQTEDPKNLKNLRALAKKIAGFGTLAAAEENLSPALNFINKTKHSNDDEFNFFLENYDKLSHFKTKGFSQQQRGLNVILDMNAGQTVSQNLRKGEKVDGYEPDWMIPASLGLSATFGKYFPTYLKKATTVLSVHDATYWLPYDLPEAKAASLASFVDRNLIYDKQGEKMVRELGEMEVIAKNWNGLKPEQEKLPFKDILHICRSRKYDNQRYGDFAMEASKWGVDETQYKDLEDMYHAGLKVPTPFATDKEFKSGELTGRFLPRDDARVGFFGAHTDCCQHFDGVGKACAISSVMDSYSQLFVIEDKKGSIVAGSWVWVNEDHGKKAVVFDNIEAKGEYIKSAKLNDIYEQVGEYVTKDAGYAKATIGGGYQDAYIDNYKKTESVSMPKPYGSGYTDADTQYLLAENKKAPEVKDESLRYIRDAISLDIDDMQSVANVCFPDGDKGLQIPEEVNGLVLLDEKKGIVGYVLFDDEEKSIYDMAVLPDYRTDKNASSKKLLAEVAKHVREQGGEWSAELRDKTTLRYMQTMAERGIIDMDVGSIDHEMSDGSKVYEVKFSVNSERPAPKPRERTTEEKPVQPKISQEDVIKKNRFEKMLGRR